MDTQQLGTALTGYVQLFQEARRLVNDEQVATVIIEQIGKDARTAQLMQGRNGSSGNSAVSNGDLPATEKQIGYLKKLGVDVPAGLTKQAASELIEKNK